MVILAKQPSRAKAVCAVLLRLSVVELLLYLLQCKELTKQPTYIFDESEGAMKN